MEREIQELKTKSGLSFKIVTYATAREQQAVDAKLYGTAEVGVSKDGQPELKGFSPMFRVEQEKEMIRLLCKSIGDKTENLVEVALELRNEDYESIVAEVSKLVKKN